MALFLKVTRGEKVPKNLPPPLYYIKTPPPVLYELGGPDTTDTHYLTNTGQHGKRAKDKNAGAGQLGQERLGKIVKTDSQRKWG